MDNFDLKRFRQERKVSQKELAKILGIGQPFISQIENGKDPIPETLIEKLKDVYGTSDVVKYQCMGKGVVYGPQSIAGHGNTISGNVNITLPEKGFQKIIRSDGTQTTVEVASSLAENESRDLAIENVALRKEINDLKNRIIDLQGRLLEGK